MKTHEITFECFASLRQWLSDVVSNPTVRKTIGSLIDQGMLSATNLFIGIMIGRICLKEQLGLYALGMTIIAFAMSTQGALIIMPYCIYRPRLNGIPAKDYNGSTMLHQLFLALVVIFILIITSLGIHFFRGKADILPIIKTLCLTLFFVLSWDYARQTSFALLKVKSAIVIDAVVSCFQIAFMVLLYYLNQLSAANVLLMAGIAYAITSLFWLYGARESWRFRLSNAWRDLVLNLNIGKWTFASSILWRSGIYLYPWLLAYFHGADSTGIWAACISIVNITNPLVLGLQNYFRPMIAHSFKMKDTDALKRATTKSNIISGCCISLVTIIILLAGGPLVSFVYGAEYSGNHLTVMLLALNTLATTLSFSPSRALFTIERADIDFKINLISMFNLIVFGIFFTWKFGTTGAAAALLIANIISTILSFVVYNRAIRALEENPEPLTAGRQPQTTAAEELN